MEENAAKNFESQLQDEIEKRLAIIEDSSYDFGEKFSKANWIGAIVTIVASLLLILYGAF
jgi:hypothetical protein